jgi:glyoxylase-like metal-dependent hydrolase (beta-lactamase superfamily II)
MSRPRTDYRFRSGGRSFPPVARWLVHFVWIALLAAGGDSPAAWTGGGRPARPPAAATGTQAGTDTQSATDAQSATGTPGGQTPSPPTPEAGAVPDTPSGPAGAEAADVAAPAPFVGPPEPPWLYGPPAPGIEEIAVGLYVASGYGGNVVARITPEGGVVAGELTPAAETIAEWIAGVSDEPIRYIVRTHGHGNAPAVLPAPWRSARIVAPETGSTFSAAAVRSPAAPPDLSFTRGLSLFLGAAEVQIHHFAPAHTGNDAVVLFPDLGVLYAGDLVGPGMPFIDYAAGGSSGGWVEALDGILALDFQTLVPGVGQPLTKRDAQVFRDRLVTLRMRTMQLLYRDVAREDALALLQTADLDWPFTDRSPFAARSFGALYDELTMERQEAREAAAAEAATDEVAEGTARP